ncbi:MAG: FAD/NAD(P)-binding protein [Kutzneria sp.]|nr:FAD/NAD(P)-binding protein [Kutzneria sp.]
MLFEQTPFGVVFCGGGPAAIGPIIAAARTGRLDDLLNRGIALIEPGPIGPGGFAHHRIAANSLGGPFLECLDDLDGTPFAALRELPETRALRALADVHPPLSVVASFLARLGAVVSDLLQAHPRCRSVSSTVVGLRLAADTVHVATADGGRLHADRVVIASGGRPLSDFAGAEIVPGLSLAPHRAKVWHSEAFIDARRRAPAARGKVVIVGGSHSAWSVADLILSDVDELTVVHRSGIRLFYRGVEQARSDGYLFDPVRDVCPASGRVNRYGGLRGRAFELARAALGLAGPGPRPVRLVHVDGPESRPAAERAFADADLIVMANGFEAALPPISYADGTPLIAAVGPTGTVVTATGHLVDVRGNVHPNLLAYGLGAGLAPSAEVGGEPSYTRRADGVWLYQYDIGRIVLDDLLHTATTSGEIHA